MGSNPTSDHYLGYLLQSLRLLLRIQRKLLLTRHWRHHGISTCSRTSRYKTKTYTHPPNSYRHYWRHNRIGNFRDKSNADGFLNYLFDAQLSQTELEGLMFVPTPKQDLTAQLAPLIQNVVKHLTEWNPLPFTILANYNTKQYKTTGNITRKQRTALKSLMKKRSKHPFLLTKAMPPSYLATNNTLTKLKTI